MAAVTGSYSAQIFIDVGESVASLRIVVDGYKSDGSFSYAYDWDLTTPGVGEKHTLRAQPSPPTVPINPTDLAVWSDNATQAFVTLTPYDATSGAQGTGTAGNAVVFEMALPQESGSGVPVGDGDTAKDFVASRLKSQAGGSLEVVEQTNGDAEIRLKTTVSTADPSGTPDDGELWFKREA